MSTLSEISTWQRLGSGVHASVWRARKLRPSTSVPSSPAGKLDAVPIDPLDDIINWVAVKVVYDNRNTPPHNIEREAAILKRISHPNIISLLAFERRGSEAPYALQMPLIPLSLNALLSSPLFAPNPLTGPYSAFARLVLASHSEDKNPFEVVARSIIYQLLLAVVYIHSLDPPIAHRDINPGNILIDQYGFVKLVDFGIGWDQPQSNVVSSARVTANILSKDWEETSDNMCCQVATGPYRAPELLFSPKIYSAKSIDLWALGASIAQFFTPLQLIPSGSPISYPGVDESPVETNDVPFMIPQTLRKNIDYQAKWERRTLFDGERGELGLAWSIFKIRGTPNKDTWPEFSSLPDAQKIEFQVASPKSLQALLPNLPCKNGASPDVLIDGLLAYPYKKRLAAAEALNCSWFSTELLLPQAHPGQTDERLFSRISVWEGRSLSEWLEPALRREANRVTRIDS